MPTGWFVIEPPTSGVMPPALRRAKANFTGQQPFTGPLTPKLPKVLASLNGRVDPAGGISSKIQRTKCSMAGTQTQYGTMGAKLKKPTANFAVENQGQMSASIKRTLSALNGKQTFTGALGSALRRAKATLAGSQNQSGAMISQSKRLTAAMTGTLPGITVNSTSAGNANTSNANTLNVDITITVASGANRVLYVGVLTTHTTRINPTFSASSNIGTGGSTPTALTQITSIGYGDAGGGFRSSNLAVFKLVNPAVRTHTITLQATASQQLLNICGGGICLNGVGSEGTPVTQLSTTSNEAVKISSAANIPVGDEVICFSGVGGTPTWGGGNPTPFFTQTPESNTLAGFNTDGAGAVVTYTSTTSNHKVGSILIPISKP